MKEIYKKENIPLPRSFYMKSTTEVAKKLLGKLLVIKDGKKVQRLLIVETEAYLGLNDPACHSYGRKKTPRKLLLYQEGGFSYVYFIYGMYFCFNVVTGPKEHPEAVLIRALEEWDENKSNNIKSEKNFKKYSGPGKLCRELGITKEDNGMDLTMKKRIWLEEGIQLKRDEILETTRVGVESYGEAAAWPLRFYVKGSKAVSRLPKHIMTTSKR